MKPRVLVAGAGWLGAAIARSLLASGATVVVARRRREPLQPLVDDGAVPLVVDFAEAGASRMVPDVDAVVACQSSGADDPASYRVAYVDATRELLAGAARVGARAFVYTGSTGVFGQRDGSDVDETTPVAPAGPTADVLAEAERLVLGPAGRPAGARLLRLSGLYGPGRTGILDRVRSGRLSLGPGDGAWMNFCHLDDAVAFVRAALDRGAPGAVYHGSDAAPARRSEVVRWIAGRLGIAPPVADAAPGGPDRRILSAATRARLAVELRYPSFREGLDPAIRGIAR